MSLCTLSKVHYRLSSRAKIDLIYFQPNEKDREEKPSFECLSNESAEISSETDRNEEPNFLHL